MQDQCLHEADEEPPAEGSPTSVPFALVASPLGAPNANEAPQPVEADDAGLAFPVRTKETERGHQDGRDSSGLIDVFVDEYFEGQITYEEILTDCTGTPRGSGCRAPLGASSPEGAPTEVPPGGPQLETLHAIIFLPPKYHLLLKFTVSPRTTIVRIATDWCEALGYLDAFFSVSYALTTVRDRQTHENF